MRWLRAWWWKILIALAVVFVLMQFVPYRVDNPPARDEPKWDSPRTRDLAMRSCGDCHSNETKVPWFEQIAPLKWYIANHVKEGRAALNFSEWHSAAGEEARDAAEPVDEGTMPPDYYTWLGLHSGAKLSSGGGQGVGRRPREDDRRRPARERQGRLRRLPHCSARDCDRSYPSAS